MTGEARDVAILGGGMAGLAAAWKLSDPAYRDRIASVTLYQRGARLGGKAASHRGENGRIEEHGLHVWLGYYDNAFRLIRECYEQLDRETTDPHCPIRTWRDAFEPAPLIGLEDLSDGQWRTWTAVFPPNDRVPGEPLGDGDDRTAADFLRQSVGLMAAFVQSLGGPRVDLGAGLALGALSELARAAGALGSVLPIFKGAEIGAAELRDRLAPVVAEDPGSRRLWQLIDLVAAQLRGLVKDDLISRGFRSIDHIEYRDWIASHGASPATVDGPLVSGLYDLAFSHRGGEPSKTEFPAGLGLALATRTFFDYRGALFWKMQAGMGDVVIAPLYQALVERGVRFRFFHRVDELTPNGDGTAIERVRLAEQVKLRPGVDRYEPLQRFDGLPCFAKEIDRSQLLAHGDPTGGDPADGDPAVGDPYRDLDDAHLESYWSQWPDAAAFELERGRDFDELVFAIPVGMARHVTGPLAACSARWARMLDTLETVGTQAFQLWLDPSETELGWTKPGSTITSYVDSYDTWSSMTHLLEVEQWPSDRQPGTVAYFCSSLAQEPKDDRSDVEQPGRAHRRARDAAIGYLENDIGHYWPGAVDDAGRFRWELLSGATPGSGSEAIDSQFVTANVDPSDRYVQALPGTDHVRLRPNGSGFDHLHLAGDWTDSGLNAGCIEAAVLSGLQAANSVLGLAPGHGISGGYLDDPATGNQPGHPDPEPG